MANIDTIINNSPNYDKIVNFLYQETDEISKILVENYQEHLFGNNKNKKKLDMIFDIYTNKDEFYHYIQNYFSEFKDELYSSKLMSIMSKLYDSFEKERLSKIDNARWL